MDEPRIELRRADGDALEYVQTLLERNDLPSSDVRSGPGRFYVAADGEDPVGVGGFEQYGTDALLRSVVVEEGVRGEGYGTALCGSLENEARRDGVERLYLLTATASAFFAGLRYEKIERTGAPAAIRGTTEFADLCPSTATCMAKSL